VLARGTEREFRDLHHSINHRFERVSARLETIEARIEVFSRRTDDEIEQRHKLAERLSMRRVQTLRRQQKPPLQWLSRRMVQTVRRR
jgi:hypothetical protein